MNQHVYFGFYFVLNHTKGIKKLNTEVTTCNRSISRGVVFDNPFLSKYLIRRNKKNLDKKMKYRTQKVNVSKTQFTYSKLDKKMII